MSSAGVFSTTIIPSIGRPVLSRAVHSLLEQTLTEAEYEVVVVNDSGSPLLAADWMASPRVRVIDTQRRERVVARNAGASIARGRYLHFLDDDDWLAPGALHSLWQLAQTQPAAWLYGATQLVDRSGKPVLQLRHGLQGNCFTQVMAGEWIPLPASLVDAKVFFQVEGFNPRALYVEDTDLLRKVARVGDLAETQDVVAWQAVGEAGSSTNYRQAPENGRYAREGILDQPGVFARLRSSATDSFWCGRVVRLFLTSFVWNLKRRRPLTATSRALFGLAALGWSLPSWPRPDYWRAVGGRYESRTFEKGMQAGAGDFRPAHSD